MRCLECNQSAEVRKRKAYLYDGVTVKNLYILNAEVLLCSACEEESLILHQASKLHAAMGLAVARQPARLSGEEIKFLRRGAGFSLRDWSKRIGVAEATYSKWENGHRPITAQPDRLARLNFIIALVQKGTEITNVDRYIAEVLGVDIDNRRDFAIAVDAETMGVEYLPIDSPLLATMEMAFVEAPTLMADMLGSAVIGGERSTRTLTSTPPQNLAGGARNASNDLALAA